MTEIDIRQSFFAYWEQLERTPGWIDLGMGMPPIDLFAPLLAVEPALVSGLSQRADYQPQHGLLDVRAAIAAHEQRHTGKNYTADHVMLVSGALRGFSLVLDTIVETGTKLVEIVPTYPLLAGHARDVCTKRDCTITTITPHDRANWKITADEVLPYINSQTIVYATYPNNPTGQYIDSHVLATIAEACSRCGSYLLIDQTCDSWMHNQPNTYDWVHYPAVIRVNGFSKNFLLAGLRTGYIIANPQIIQRCAGRYTFSDGNAPTIVNPAIVECLRTPSLLPFITEVTGSLVGMALAYVAECPSVQQIITPESCFYIFLKVKYDAGSWQLFERLLQGGVNIVPGVLFGVPDKEAWIRICCARHPEELDAGMVQLQSLLGAL